MNHNFSKIGGTIALQRMAKSSCSLLGLDFYSDFDMSDVRKAFKEYVKTNHPDMGSVSDIDMEEAKSAREFLIWYLEGGSK